MHNFKKIYIVILGLVISGFSYGQALYKPMKDTASFKKSMAEVAKKTRTLKSDFVQEKNLSVLSEKIISKGKFYFKKDNLLRWEYIEPFQYLIVLNGESVLIKDGQKVSKYDVQSNKLFKEINDMMVGMIQGKILSNKMFDIAFLENDKYFIIKSQPLQKNKKEFLQDIFLFFDKKDLGVEKINITEPSGDYTEIIFTNRQTNTEIPDAEFIVK